MRLKSWPADIDQKKIRELFEEFDDEDGDKTIH